MAFEDIAVVDVGVEPGATGDNYRFTFLLSRVPDRFWPEAFLVAYGAQSGLRRVELAERTVTITLREAEAAAYATDERQRRDDEQQRRARAEELVRQARQALGI